MFETSEPLQNAIDWLVSLLVVDWCPFELRNPQLNVTFLSESIDEADRRRSLLELNLAPTMLLNFSWSKELLEDMSKQMASQQKDNSNPLATLQCYLHPEYLAAAGPEWSTSPGGCFLRVFSGVVFAMNTVTIVRVAAVRPFHHQWRKTHPVSVPVSLNLTAYLRLRSNQVKLRNFGTRTIV